eukprot:scaffold31853_cov71-Phaeocystis_antarctica.AAC.6
MERRRASSATWPRGLLTRCVVPCTWKPVSSAARLPRKTVSSPLRAGTHVQPSASASSPSMRRWPSGSCISSAPLLPATASRSVAGCLASTVSSDVSKWRLARIGTAGTPYRAPPMPRRSCSCEGRCAARPVPRRSSASRRARPARARGRQPPSPPAAAVPRHRAQQTAQRCARRTRGPSPSRKRGAAALCAWMCCTPKAVRTRSARIGYLRAHSARDAAVDYRLPPWLPGGTACAADTSPTRASGPYHQRRMPTSPQQAGRRSGGWQ